MQKPSALARLIVVGALVLLAGASARFMEAWTPSASLAGAARGMSSGSSLHAAGTNTLRITALEPGPGTVLTTAPRAVRITFSKPFLASSLNHLTVRLLRSGDDGSFADGNHLVLDAPALVQASATQAVLDLSGISLPDGLYQITLLGTSPFDADLEANVLALEASGALLPPPRLFRRIRRQLALIRRAYPQMTGIHERGPYVPGELLVGLTPAAVELARRDAYHGLDALNAEYGGSSSRGSSFSGITIHFALPYNLERLAALYRMAPGVRYAEPNYLAGISEWIDAAAPRYLFRKGWGDCPAGCIGRHEWTFHVEGGSVLLQAESGDPPGALDAAPIVDTHAVPLDGEFGGSFPSGDGEPGGDFVATFTLETPPLQTSRSR